MVLEEKEMGLSFHEECSGVDALGTPRACGCLLPGPILSSE